MTCVVSLCILMGGWLVQHGYDKPHTDAVLRYVKRESDFNPNIIERSGACLMQWAGKRRRAILAQGRGRCPSWEEQMAFADYELHHVYCGFWHALDPYLNIRVHFGAGAIERCR